jgi:hypothetical protein
MFKQDKKQLLNEGRAVGGSFFNYGGFPRILKESHRKLDEIHADMDKAEEEYVTAKNDLLDIDPGLKGSSRWGAIEREYHKKMQLLRAEKQAHPEFVDPMKVAASTPATEMDSDEAYERLRRRRMEDPREAPAARRPRLPLNPQERGEGPHDRD